MAIQFLLLLLGAVALIRLAPELPLSRSLSEWLAAKPARWLLRRSRQEMIAWAIVAALIAFAGEYVLVIGGPQMAIGLAVDLAAYVDAMIAVVTLASAARAQGVARWFRLKAGVRRPRVRAIRTRRAKRLLPPANDSEDGPRRLAA
jgi:hypothetical protein